MTEFRFREFGSQVRKWRLAFQPPKTQREVAREVGVSDGFLAHVETGRTLPGIRTLRLLADALGVPELDMLRAAGYLSKLPAPPRQELVRDPELRLFFRDDWEELSNEERELFRDFVRMLKTRLRRRQIRRS